jgi:hypothetical protein
MKYYETHFEEYTKSVEEYNLHPEMLPIYEKFPKSIANLGNLIFYGPTGIGKYSQVLTLLKKYSPSELKYDKKILIQTDKQDYTYRISDIHYEIDMALLGCNSKLVWHEIFFQIIDIISVKAEKTGIIVCKNFHLIHGELLETFYSYIQQYNYPYSNIHIQFILITEHISFFPNKILNCCQIIHIERPSIEKYKNLFTITNKSTNILSNGKSKKLREHSLLFGQSTTQDETATIYNSVLENENETFIQKISNLKKPHKQESDKITAIMNHMNPEYIINIKELKSFTLIDTTKEIPKDIFNIICDNIIKEIENPKKIIFTSFRDVLYDILIYNLDVTECIWYILCYFINEGKIKESDSSAILSKTYIFLKYYNNNYRPIYHLESIFFYFIIKIHGF